MERSAEARLEAIRAALNTLLMSEGFGSVEGPTSLEDRRFDRWIRRSTWKADIFEIDCKRLQPNELNAKALVKLSLPDRLLTIDGASLAFLGGRSEGYRLEHDDVLGALEEDVRKGLVWLSKYETPDRMYKRMELTDRNGCGVGTKPHQEAMAVLTRLVQR